MVILFFYSRETQDTEPSFIVCEDLLPTGRMSFKNFNPSVDVRPVFFVLIFFQVNA